MITSKPRVRVQAGSSLYRPVAGYLRDQPVINMPVPALRDRVDDVRSAWYRANALATDAALNNGWIAGVVEQMVSSMIGTGLRLSYKPDGRVFGWDDQATGEYARIVEKRWGIWSSQPRECDAGARYTVAQMQAAVIRQWAATGEALGQITAFHRVGAESFTKVKLIPSHWLSRETREYDGLQTGVYLDANGAATGYLFNVRDRFLGQKQVIQSASDNYGRPVIIHVFDGEASQVRGITPLAPALKIVRQFDQLSDATLTAAMIHAIFAATVESDYPTSDVMNALKDAEEQVTDLEPGGLAGGWDAFMDAKVGWNRSVNIDLGRNGKIAHLLPGEKLKLQSSEHPNSTYESFAKFLLREIAACLGVLPSDLTGDYTGDTYSSIRMGIAKKWPLVEYRRKHIPARFTQGIFEAWLEEEIDTGRIKIPGGISSFLQYRTSLTRAHWRGPPKPQADDTKASAAHATWLRMGVITQEQICNDLGLDFEDVMEQLSRERKMREAMGLPDPVLAMSGGSGASSQQTS